MTIEPRHSSIHHLSDRVLYQRSEEMLFEAARLHCSGRRSGLRKRIRRYLKPYRRNRSFLSAIASSVGKALLVAYLLAQLWATEVNAQPSFSSSSPANATHATAVGANISATFTEAIAAGTVSSTTFVLHGGFIGKHLTGGTASTHKDATYTGGGTTTLTINPGADFAPGELLSVTLTTGLQNGSAQALTAARVYQFRAAATGGPAVFSNASRDVETGTANATFSTSSGDLDGDGDLDLVTGNNGQVNRVYLGNGNGTFAAGSDVETGTTNSTRFTSLGDLDGDGDLDLITGNFNQVNRVYLGTGSGAFAAGSDVETGTTNKTYATSLGDLDGDGDLDLVTGNQSQVNRVYLGNGSGAFAAGSDVETGTTNATNSTSLGDLDGDGDLDLITGNQGVVNRVYLGNGSGGFAAGSDVETGTTNQTYATSLGDLDGDGDLDLITGNRNQVNRVYLGNGSGAFAGSDVETGTTNDTRGTSLGDLDGDGDLDLITGNQSQVNRVYLGNGSGAFAAGSDVETGTTNATNSTSLGDLDGDGDLDLITGNQGVVNRVYLGNGSGGFAAGSDVETGTTNQTYATSLGDLDGDGDLDLITGNRNQVNRVYLGNGSGAFAGSDVETGTTNDTRGTSLGDLDGDGDLDLITSNYGQVNRVYLGNGSGSFATGGDIATPTNKTLSTSLGDLDGDGDLDLIAGNYTQVNRVYLNNNTNFSSSSPTVNANNIATTSNVSATFSQSMQAAASSTFIVHGSMTGKRAGSYSGASTTTLTFDPTNDFRPGEVVDVMLTAGLKGTAGDAFQKPKSYRFRAAATAGLAVFSNSSVDVETGTTNATLSTALGDLDGDGDLDLVTGNNGQVNRVYLNTGSGSFAAGSDVETGTTNSTRSTSLGDLDGDGDLDLITGNATQVNRVYLGTGNGTFAAGSDVETGTTNTTTATSLGDLDGDGDLDLITGNQNQVNRVYLNTGSGSFAAGSDVETGTTNSTRSTSLVDLDGDGDIDLIIGNQNQVNRVYLNTGVGSFAAGSDVETGATNTTRAVSLGDLDGDGDLDLVTGNYSQVNRVYHNGGNKDGTLTASATVDESSAIALPSTATTSGAAVDLFDFTLTDGGGGDGLTLDISQLVINTSGTGPFSQVTWLLNGPDASNVSGTYSSSANTITFSGLSISVADGGNETYTLRGYYSTNTGLTEAQTFSFSIDGDTDVTMTNTLKSSMAINSSAVSNAVAAQVGVTATQLTFTTQPAPLALTSGTQLDFTTDPVVSLKDAAGNLDLTATSVTLSENGAGTSTFVNNTVTSASGVATFSGLLLTYSATADQESFALEASASGVTSATSNSLTADVVATELAFTTQPAPLALTSGTQLDFSTDPVVTALDADGLTDTGFSSVVTLSEDGAGTSTFLNNAVTPTNGVATFGGLLLTYNALDASSIQLVASAGSLTATTSSFAVTAFPLEANNNGASTSEGGTATISSDQLKFTDAASTNAQIVYTIGTAPAVGEIRKSGTALGANGTFTQDDIDNGLVSYAHNGSENFTDSFTYTVKGTAGLSTSSFAFGFEIEPVNDAPSLDVLRDVPVEEGGYVVISNGYLRILDGDTHSSKLIFTVQSAPVHGSLNQGSFSQADIDELLVLYSHDGSDSTADSLHFSVADAAGLELISTWLRFVIQARNDAPVIPSIEHPSIKEGELLVLDLTATDPEGASVATTVTGLPSGATLDGTVLKWLPLYDQAGTYPLGVDYDDGEGGTSRLRFEIHVAETPIPMLMPEPSLLDFGDVPAGENANMRFVLVNNAPISMDLAPFASTSAYLKVVSPTFPLALSPGAQADITVRFAAAADRADLQQATLSCATEFGQVEVSTLGRSVWSRLVAADEEVRFLPATIGDIRWRHLTLSNPGNLPLEVEAQLPAGTVFGIDPISLTLKGGTERIMRVRFAPATDHPVETLLSLLSTAGQLDIPLRCQGREPEAGPVSIDFNLEQENQQQSAIGGAMPGSVYVLQLHANEAPAISGWSVRLDFDPNQVSYVDGSFAPGGFLSSLTPLASVGDGYVEIGGDVLNRQQPASGNGILGTLSFQVQDGFSDQTELAVSRVTWHREDWIGPDRTVVYAPASINAVDLVPVEPEPPGPSEPPEFPFPPVPTQPSAPPKVGDFNTDGRVTMDDLFLMADQFNQTVPPGEARFDFNEDGVIDNADILALVDLIKQDR